jgi:hypothetical protein
MDAYRWMDERISSVSTKGPGMYRVITLDVFGKITSERCRPNLSGRPRVRTNVRVGRPSADDLVLQWFCVQQMAWWSIWRTTNRIPTVGCGNWLAVGVAVRQVEWRTVCLLADVRGCLKTSDGSTSVSDGHLDTGQPWIYNGLFRDFLPVPVPLHLSERSKLEDSSTKNVFLFLASRIPHDSWNSGVNYPLVLRFGLLGFGKFMGCWCFHLVLLVCVLLSSWVGKRILEHGRDGRVHY